MDKVDARTDANGRGAGCSRKEQSTREKHGRALQVAGEVPRRCKASGAA
jgi:hypothetical protein